MAEFSFKFCPLCGAEQKPETEEEDFEAELESLITYEAGC